MMEIAFRKFSESFRDCPRWQSLPTFAHFFNVIESRKHNKSLPTFSVNVFRILGYFQNYKKKIKESIQIAFDKRIIIRLLLCRF
jgi:hypothetical protein